MLKPSPEHPITLEPAKARWRAKFEGHVIADTDDAIILQEADYRPVVYFPRRDVAMEYMSRTRRQTHCPYKGDAAYYSLNMDGDLAENAVWTYEHPFEGMEPIAERLAFYTDRVQVYAVDDAVVNPRRGEQAEPAKVEVSVKPHNEEEAERAAIDAAVQHTDAGDGHSQFPHWSPNVGPPRGGSR